MEQKSINLSYRSQGSSDNSHIYQATGATCSLCEHLRGLERKGSYKEFLSVEHVFPTCQR